MTRLRSLPGATADALWADVAERTVAWAAAGRLALADTVLLVPAVHHVASAQRAFASHRSGLPRIETAATLAAAHAPAASVSADQLSLDVATDRLVAGRMLQRRAIGSGATVAHAAAAVVNTAHALANAAAAVAPDRRDAQIAAWRRLLAIGAGQGAHGEREERLARIALEWAALAPAPVTDVLFGLRPAGWVVVQSELPGAPTTLASAVIAAAGDVPTLHIDASLDVAAQAESTRRCDWTVTVCTDFEDEASRSAVAVIDHLNAGRVPVALIAQDRLLVRRVHALLGRQQVPTKDETGWTMATTRAAAALRSVLRCARHGATCDDWLDWLKSCPLAHDDDVAALERSWRRQRARTPGRVVVAGLPASAVALWHRSTASIGALTTPPRRTLGQWQEALGTALGAFGLGASLAADAAGAQLLAALRLVPPRMPAAVDPNWRIDLATYADWIETGMEEHTFLPPFVGEAGQRSAAALPAVVITPLGRAAWRSFGAIVFPGADGQSFGAASPVPTLFSDAQSVQLGLLHREAAQARQKDALAQLLRQPHVDFLRSTQHAGRPLPESPALQWLQFARQAPSPARHEERTLQHVPFQPVPQPLPHGASLLPERLSASACSDLRTCPYRFHALHLLKLRGADELGDEASKRDYGTWLHDVLRAFHAERDGPRSAEADRLLLAAGGESALAQVELDDFLPFAASFARLVPRYVTWVQARDAAGARWIAGETPLTAHPDAWGGIAMYGKLDRIDVLSETDADGRPVQEIIDYKTTRRDKLSDGLNAGEDTQLAFYAALVSLQPHASRTVRAAYLPLDESTPVATLACDDVEERAALLVDGIGHDLDRLRAGAAMPALGEGDACTHCDARGLCRRDHWAPPATSPARPEPDTA